MKLTLVASDDSCTQVRVAERIGRELTSSSEPLGTLLGEGAYARRVLVDLSAATFIDSTGVSWLIVCLKRFREAGGHFALHSPPPLILKVLTAMQLHRVLDIAGTEAEAREMLLAGGRRK